MNENLRGRLTRDGIRIFEDQDFAGMHKAGALAASILDRICEHVFPGQTTGAAVPPVGRFGGAGEPPSRAHVRLPSHVDTSAKLHR